MAKRTTLKWKQLLVICLLMFALTALRLHFPPSRNLQEIIDDAFAAVISVWIALKFFNTHSEKTLP
jgi:hypothetical protein